MWHRSSPREFCRSSMLIQKYRMSAHCWSEEFCTLQTNQVNNICLAYGNYRLLADFGYNFAHVLSSNDICVKLNLGWQQGIVCKGSQVYVLVCKIGWVHLFSVCSTVLVLHQLQRFASSHLTAGATSMSSRWLVEIWGSPGSDFCQRTDCYCIILLMIWWCFRDFI